MKSRRANWFVAKRIFRRRCEGNALQPLAINWPGSAKSILSRPFPGRSQNGSRRGPGENSRARVHHLEAQSSAVQKCDHEGAGLAASRLSIRDFEWVSFCKHRTHTHSRTTANQVSLFLSHRIRIGASSFPQKMKQSTKISVLIQLPNQHICTFHWAMLRPVRMVSAMQKEIKKGFNLVGSGLSVWIN